MALDELYLENIDEFVNDENQVVTYKWLSMTLKVHVNRAKQMLYSYLQQQLTKQNNINVTYLISGYEKVEGTQILKVAIVKEDKLDVWKSRLDPITSLHIYSIQKSKLKNSNALYIADFDKQKESLTQINRYSAINCPEAIPRPNIESKKFEEVPFKVSSIPESQKTNPVKSGNEVKSKLGAIANLFAAQGSKKKQESVREDEEEKGRSSINKNKSDCVTSVKSKELFHHKETKQKKISTEEKHQKKSKRDVFSSESEEEDPLPKKKLKRIQSFCDSSSEEETAAFKPENSLPLSSRHLEEDKIIDDVKQLSLEKESKPLSHHHRRKLVPKTFMDEDGFMVTKKVMESGSESEPENRVPENRVSVPKRQVEKSNYINSKTGKPRKTSKKRAPSPSRNKQASLTAFFKKI